MKDRRNGIIQLAILVALGAAVLLSLAAPDLEGRDRSREPVEVSVLIRSADSSRWANTRLGMEQAAGDLGAELRFLTPGADNDREEQKELLRREVERGTDALVLAPVDPADLGAEWETLTRGTPTVTLESELPEAVALITPDNEALGWALARRALEEYRGGTVLLLDCLPENTGVQARVEAAEAALIRGGATVLRWSETGEEELIRLDEEGALAQVVALEIGATEAAAQAKERAGSSAALYGVGVTSRIAAWLERGTISAVAAWSEYAAGYLAVQQAAGAAREKEGESLLKINLSIADGQSNQTLQMEQVDRFLDWGCDVLCVNMVDRTAAAVIVDKAEEAGVPVIFFNRQPVEEDLQRWEKAYYVGPRGEQSGIFQGQIVWEQWQEDRERVDRNGDGVLQYVMLEGEPSHQDALLRTEYSIKTLTNAGVLVEKLASDTANWNRGQAAAKMSQWHQEFGSQIEAVFANNDDMALGAIDVLLEAGVAPEEMPVIVGVDATAPALEAMAAGTLSGTVQNAKEMPQVLMDLALSLYAGEDPAQAADLTAEHYVWLPYREVNRENFRSFQEE